MCLVERNCSNNRCIKSIMPQSGKAITYTGRPESPIQRQSETRNRFEVPLEFLGEDDQHDWNPAKASSLEDSLEANSHKQFVREGRGNESDVFLSRDMKKSYSFGGYGLLPGVTDHKEVTFAEINTLVEKGKKEPTKTTKQKIKEFAEKYKDFKVKAVGRLPWYRQVLHSSQLAHLITLVAVVSLAFRLCPDSRRSPSESSTMTRLVYIAAVSAVFGTECWMTFVSGLALFFTVPRHVFAQVQVVLMPLYFLVKAVLLLFALLAYTQHRPTHTWDLAHGVQGTLLAAGFLINLSIRLYFSPPLINLITIKMAIEREEGLGSDVGSTAPGRLRHCPHYMRLQRAFRKVHSAIAVGNLVSMATTAVHLYTMAIELCSAL